MQTPYKRSFPHLTKMIARLFAEGVLTNVADVQIEPEFGYCTRIEYVDGSIRMTRGNDVGLNSAASYEVANDKAFTKYFLESKDIKCAPGASFLLDWWGRHLNGDSYTRSALTDIRAYVHEHAELPVYVKPVDGSKGQNVWKCRTLTEIETALNKFDADKVRVCLIEHDVDLPDYRLVVLDNDLISAYRRIPLAVIGDGQSTLLGLLESLQNRLLSSGRDTVLDIHDARIRSKLSNAGLDLDYIPDLSQTVQLQDISNLSAGGMAIDYTTTVAQRWVDLAVEISRNLGLRYCGVDLACRNIESGDGPYFVIEVNASPGLQHYGSVGNTQEQIVRSLYTRVINAFPLRDRG